MFAIDEIDAAIHETKAIRRTHYGVGREFKNFAMRHLDIRRLGKLLTPGIDYCCVAIPK
jgi:hypothetical protein